ncbi:MAG: hypothetical protein IKM54_05305 [Butyricicoccus sp.]|nr:hypothetical protein [Butyricicoccus sp.]
MKNIDTRASLRVSTNPTAENRENTAPQKEETAFRCPECLMADTCGDCSQHGSDGRCNKWGGYTDSDKWACSWYYSH